MLVLPGPAYNAALSRLPIGGDHGTYAGLEDAVVWARGELPAGATLYHQDLGWHLAFYLFDGGPEARWYSDPNALVTDIARRDRPAYVIVSATSPVDTLENVLAQHGLNLELRHTAWAHGQTTFSIYKVRYEASP